MNMLSKGSFLLLFSALALGSCKKDKNVVEASNNNIQLTGAAVAPTPSGATGAGQMQAFYSSKTHLLTYTVAWTQLSGNPTAIHIHGLADAGFVAVGPPAAPGPYANGIIQTLPSIPASTSASYSGSLFIDNVVIREEDLLAGKYYIDIHTAAKPAGELRGQIVLNRK